MVASISDKKRAQLKQLLARQRQQHPDEIQRPKDLVRASPTAQVSVKPKTRIPATASKRRSSSKISAHKDKLAGARFRYLNELLYTTKSKDAFQQFQSEPHLFREYHEGFRAQVKQWPSNPLHEIMDTVRKATIKSGRVVVADMGCGEAEMAQTLVGKEKLGSKLTVHSFDLVAHNEFITAANIASVPLENASCDYVVFCLSLMGTDYADFLREAHRILRDKSGKLLIAEVVSRIENLGQFRRMLGKMGFRTVRIDTDNKMFVMLECVKEGTIQAKVPSVELKPCKYKRR